MIDKVITSENGPNDATAFIDPRIHHHLDKRDTVETPKYKPTRSSSQYVATKYWEFSVLSITRSFEMISRDEALGYLCGRERGSS